ncbi:ATP-binding protein [Thermogemmatispora carboxidivorans]|uniref:ATP-binding protein n=1 Tax=Thermogemmatispora carboxidivorans TaxID=1382306 RepID=UPI0009DFED28|nr:ATP-binding protein [Thermogemmatispora carboxidivorans]
MREQRRSSDHFPPLLERPQRSWRRLLVDTLLACSAAGLVTAVIYTCALYPRIPNISLLYLLVVLALASTRGLYAAVLTSVLAFLFFDYFLVQPLYSLTVNRFEEWLALFVFLTAAIITGQMTNALRRQADEARRRERETRILYDLVRAANHEEDFQHQLTIVTQAVVQVFASWGVCDCVLLLPNEQGRLEVLASARMPRERLRLSSDEQATAAWVMANGQAAELHDVPLEGSGPYGRGLRATLQSSLRGWSRRRYARLLPLKTSGRVLGVLLLLMEEAEWPHLGRVRTWQPRLNGSAAVLEGPFFSAFLDQAAAIIERARLRQEGLQLELLRQTDALRTALLSSVSHDLRTPLASIKAAASSLLQEDIVWDEESRRSFALTIEREADRLNRLVENLLDMSRIEGGALKPEKEWYPLDELIHDVLLQLQPLLQQRPVQVDLEENLPPVPVDYLQLSQVLTNLIENAVRHTPASSPIEIKARSGNGYMQVSVADRGPGIPSADLERIFDKFYRVRRAGGPGSGSGRASGTGLGLAVCKGLIEAHGGRIWAENRQGGGAIFHFTLPLSDQEQESAGEQADIPVPPLPEGARPTTSPVVAPASNEERAETSNLARLGKREQKEEERSRS